MGRETGKGSLATSDWTETPWYAITNQGNQRQQCAILYPKKLEEKILNIFATKTCLSV